MKRSQAAELIDDLREIGAWDDAPVAVLGLLAKYQLKPLARCTGEAHSNAFIDNCHACAPRWGFIGPKEPVT